MLIDAVENALVLGEFRRGKGKGGGQGGGVHVAGDHEAILGRGESGFKGVFDLETGGFGNDHQRTKSGLDLLGGFVEFI